METSDLLLIIMMLLNMLISTIVPVASSFALGVKTSSCWGAKLERNKTILKASENVAQNIQDRMKENFKENFAETQNETKMTLNQIIEMLNKQSPQVINELSNRISTNSKNNYENNYITVKSPSPNRSSLTVGNTPRSNRNRKNNSNLEDILQHINDKRDINKLLHQNNTGNYRHSSHLP